MKLAFCSIFRFCVPCLLLIVIFTAESSAQQYWIRQQCPTTKALFHVAFTDSSYGWAAGDSGAIVHTTNGGELWNVQQSNINSAIEDFCFVNNSYGWAVSNDFLFTGSIILKTTNGGANWSNFRFADSNVVFRTIYFLDTQTGFIGGFTGTTRLGTIMKTTNGGANWQRCNTDSNSCSFFPVLRFNFLNSLIGYACGGVFDQAGVYWKTTDGGLNWKDSCIAGEPLFDILPLSGTKVIAIGGDFEYGVSDFTSLDGGSSWQYKALDIFGVASRLARRTQNEFWIPCGEAGRMAVSTDSCEHWTTLMAPDSGRIYDTKFTDPLHGWSVGCRYNYCSGAIYKYNTAVIGIEPGSSEVTSAFKLYQNYPNPFNPGTLIKFYLPLESKVVVNIYDALGKKVLQSDRGLLPKGETDFIFDGSGLSSGLYFYELRAMSRNSEYSETKKMVLIK